MNAVLMLLTALGATLVLRTGERIEVDGSLRQESGRVIFRSAGGTLYSLPLSEIDANATRSLGLSADAAPEQPPFKLKVSEAERDRLLRELERNHGGSAPPVQRTLEAPPPSPSRAEVEDEQRDEWEWRRQARSYEEAIRRSEEHLSILRGRAEQLEGEIRGLLSLGYKPRHFTYQTSMLQSIREQMPYAELEVTRAKRAWDQFRDDARRQGILPGWLR